MKKPRSATASAPKTRVKDAFLATVSHELRTPLTSMLGYAEIMAESGQLTRDSAHYLSIITRNANRELRLVEDLLTLATISGEGIQLRAEMVDLVPAVHEAVNAAQFAAQQSDLNLRVLVTRPPRPGVLRPVRIGQVLDNLLSNAIKFTRPGGTVEVRLRTEDTSATIDVIDTGIGIGERDTEKVFERLYRSRTAVINEIPARE